MTIWFTCMRLLNVARRLPKPNFVGGQSETCLGALAREIGLMNGGGAKRVVPHAAERGERLLDSQLDLDHRRAVARDQHEGVLEQIPRCQRRHVHARIRGFLWRRLGGRSPSPTDS